MKHDLLEILCCPVDKGDLKLKVDKESDGEIETGSLTCAQCGHVYPIEDGIPNLLPPEVTEDPGA